ncbi:hypothetical protein A9Q83_02475 [Alphaproteobacteria bacterium 46_93_T64]|nr:hypothetical protein A9Q83_02475 [Alphaproteobacteria bacterium 46_93_T64]
MTSIKHKSYNLAGVSAVLATLLATACTPIDPETGLAELRATPQNAQMSKKINVQKLNPTFVVRFDVNRTGFSDMEKGRLLGFLQAQEIKYGEDLQLELPPFDDAAGVNKIRFGAIGSFLEDEGFNIIPKVTNDGLRDSLRVFYTKYVATIDPECTKGWHLPSGTAYENLPLPHMGCATTSAFIQMLANPKDLVSPKKIGPYDGERASLSIKSYRSGSSGGSSEGGSEGGASGGSEE